MVPLGKHWKLNSHVLNTTLLRDPDVDIPAFEPYEEKGSGSSEHGASNVRPKKTVGLLKLHGSLNWLQCPRCWRIYVSAFGLNVLFLKTWKTKKTIELECWCGFKPLEPVIIAPSVFQDIRNPHLQRIWMNAYQALESADLWVFVGYSLPPEDLAVRSLLYRAYSGKVNRDGRAPDIELVCPDAAQLKPRYSGILGGRIRLVPNRFAEYVSQMRT